MDSEEEQKGTDYEEENGAGNIVCTQGKAAKSAGSF